MKAYITPYNVYTFNYEMGLTGTDIDFVDTVNAAGLSIEVASLGAWKQTLRLSGNAANPFDLDHTGFTINPTGAIEYMYHSQTAGDPAAKEDLIITLYDGATRLVKIIHDESAEAIGYDNGGGYTNIYSYPTVTWYIISIQVDIGAGVNGQFSVYVYNSSYTLLDSVEDIEFENNATKVDKIKISCTAAGGADVFYWLDNIGITAEGSYTQGAIQYMLTDSTPYMQNTFIYDGIIPYRKKFTFSCHPNNQARFNKNDFITILDDSNNDEFIGFIKTKSRDNKGLYQYECESLTNEVFERAYNKSWATNTTKEKVQDMITSKLEFCTEGTLDAVAATDWSYEYNRMCSYILYLNRFMDRQVVYILPGGAIYATDYDGLTATGKSWSLYDGNQEVWLIDIPELEDIIPGYYFGNTGITSVTVRYINNTVATRPATPSETFFKKRLKEFIDPKLQAATEVNQLGDNLYNIFSADTQFIGLRIEGEGWLQPGQTIQIQNTKQITITQAHFLIIRIIYNPKDDVYPLMVLSDNIITPREFISELKTNEMQIHTAIQQSCENQGNISTHQSSSDHDSRYYTETEMATFLGIGAANKRWINCVLNAVGSGTAAAWTYIGGDITWLNTGANDYKMIFEVPLPFIIGSKNLVLTRLKIGIYDADANDYLDHVKGYGWSDSTTLSADLINDGTNRTAAGEYTYDFADITVGGVYERFMFYLTIVATTTAEFDISYVQVEYYYT